MFKSKIPWGWMDRKEAMAMQEEIEKKAEALDKLISWACELTKPICGEALVKKIDELLFGFTWVGVLESPSGTKWRWKKYAEGAYLWLNSSGEVWRHNSDGSEEYAFLMRDMYVEPGWYPYIEEPKEDKTMDFVEMYYKMHRNEIYKARVVGGWTETDYIAGVGCCDSLTRFLKNGNSKQFVPTFLEVEAQWEALEG